ncbi:hypothetical protein Hanom_Chr13g01227281 [Helianthus anomalus]
MMQLKTVLCITSETISIHYLCGSYSSLPKIILSYFTLLPLLISITYKIEKKDMIDDKILCIHIHSPIGKDGVSKGGISSFNPYTY